MVNLFPITTRTLLSKGPTSNPINSGSNPANFATQPYSSSTSAHS
jgi:hypothetical protein